MKQAIVFLLFIGFIYSCSPKLRTQKDVADYTEDVSAFRPKIEVGEETEESSFYTPDKGPYVAPTHSINREMSVVMDSIVYYNAEKPYYTYTIQVYTGRFREEANQAREKVYRILPEEKPQLTYKQPSYKVNVGTYADRVEAYKFLTELRKAFPSATLVREQNYRN